VDIGLQTKKENNQNLAVASEKNVELEWFRHKALSVVPVCCKILWFYRLKGQREWKKMIQSVKRFSGDNLYKYVFPHYTSLQNVVLRSY
jgi:hypothetical protein